MKNRFTVFWRKGLVVLCVIALAVVGLTLTGCPTDDGGSSSGGGEGSGNADLVGTWNYTSGGYIIPVANTPAYQKLVFKEDNTITLTPVTYTWTADGSELQLKSPQATTWDGSCDYTINGSTLAIAEDGSTGSCSVMYGVYTKE